MSTLHPIEEATIGAFIIAAKRKRYLMLLANPKRRKKIIRGLYHCHDFDPKYATALPSTTDIASLLRKHGAPSHCHAISTDQKMDGREMPLEDALKAGDLLPCLLCCVPGVLACYLGEDGEQRLLLERKRS